MRLLSYLVIGAWVVAAGCSGVMDAGFDSPGQMDKGLVYLLPGIQGVDYHMSDMRRGLQEGGVGYAIKIQSWGSPVPGIGMAINQSDTAQGRAWGRTIARDIADYQRRYPGRPVYLVGQSGGAAVAVFTAEALSESGAAPISGLVLISASLGAGYNLNVALGQCQKGIVNFYNPNDVAILGVGTGIFGNLDGSHDASAGRVGFMAGGSGLRQIEITQAMACTAEGDHFAGMCANFAARYIAPWMLGGDVAGGAVSRQ